MPQFLTAVNLPQSTNSGFNALTSPATQAYPYAQSAPSNPGKVLRQLTNTESSMQTVEYGTNSGANGIQTVFSSATGTSGVVEKIKITGGSLPPGTAGNSILSDWIQISYDGGVTFPFIAELGTLFCAYPGGASGVASAAPWEASCAHMSTQQVASTGSTFAATYISTYPIPFTNGLLIQVFNPTNPTTNIGAGWINAQWAETTVAYCPSSEVPPYQLQCTGTNGATEAIAITAATNVTTTITATIPTTSFLVVGQNITVFTASGGTWSNINGTWAVVSIVNSNQFTFVVTTAPTGSYTASTGWMYHVTMATPTNGLTLNTSNVAMQGNINGLRNGIAYNEVVQLANLSGFGGWAVGLAYNAQPAVGSTYLERNFGWYVDGATAPTTSGTTTTPTAATFVITAASIVSGTSIIATVSSSAGMGVGQNVIISGASGGTWSNINGSWTIAATATGTFTFSVTSAPTGSYTASTGTVYASGSSYGTQVGSPTMQTTGTEDTFDSAFYSWQETTAFPVGVQTLATGGFASVPVTPVSATTYTNPYGVPFDIYIQAVGPISVVSLNSTTLPMTLAPGESHMVRIPPLGTVALTFSGTGPSWTWVSSEYAYGGPTTTYSSPTAMGLGNGLANHGNYYSAFLDILQSCGGYRFNTSLQLWLLTESHVVSGDGNFLTWNLLYYKDLT